MVNPLNRRRGDLVEDKKTRVRSELENILAEKHEANYSEEDGVLTKKITPTDIYKAVKSLGRANHVQGEFLLHLDDRMTEFNGFRSEVQILQKDVEKYCNDRSESCPVLPIIRKVESDLGVHLSEAELAAVVGEATAELRDRIKKQGMDEERQRFDRAIKIIGSGCLVLGSVTAFITWLLGIWTF